MEVLATAMKEKKERKKRKLDCKRSKTLTVCR